MKKLIETGYSPRKFQELIQSLMRRFNVWVLHRRFGKSVMAINVMITRGLENVKLNPRYGYLAPTYKQAKLIAWDYIKQFTKNIPGAEANEADLRVDIPRPDRGDTIRFTLLGAENPTSILGIYLDGVIFDEYDSMNPEIWTKVVRPLLSDRLGWAIFMGTPQGVKHLKAVYDHAKSLEKTSSDWIAVMLKASETGVIPQSELDDARSVMSEDQYEQEFECSWSSNTEATYFGREMNRARREGRVTHVAYEKAKPVITYWDLGISDATAIWFFQEIGKEFHLVDYHEDSNKDISEYIKVINDKGYWYLDHYLPHDAAARDMSGKTVEGLLREALSKIGAKGQRVTVLPKYGVDDTINAVKLILNKCWFDAEKCKRGLEALENYQRKWDEKNQFWSSKPLHNWASHGADAFRMLAAHYREEAQRAKDSDLQSTQTTEYNVYDY